MLTHLLCGWWCQHFEMPGEINYKFNSAISDCLPCRSCQFVHLCVHMSAGPGAGDDGPVGTETHEKEPKLSGKDHYKLLSSQLRKPN